MEIVLKYPAFLYSIWIQILDGISTQWGITAGYFYEGNEFPAYIIETFGFVGLWTSAVLFYPIMFYVFYKILYRINYKSAMYSFFIINVIHTVVVLRNFYMLSFVT